MTAFHSRMPGQGGILGRLGAIDLVQGLAESQLARYPGQHLGQGVEALDFSVIVDGNQRIAQGLDQAMIPRTAAHSGAAATGQPGGEQQHQPEHQGAEPP